MKRLQYSDIEILAPAGSFECLIAAVKSGADAIYLGGSRFGARAFANNFDEDELLRAIDYVHLHHKKVYLTMNTLVKEEELQNLLYDYLLPYYKQGIDGVIVQDIGALSYIRKCFPDLPIHASTQMTVTSMLGAQFLEKEGVERVVPARELSLEEVRKISEDTNLEIECFVHGALCYCFSGQCLYSSMIGGRSGNRGQCAQPCRLPYKTNGKTDYFMSLKDICTLEFIPDLIEAGISSFKIEGRMKKAEYVASVTGMYRKYVDLYFKVGRSKYKVEQGDVDQLRDIFNRGNFHSGYYFQHNGKDMLTPKKPSHTGVSVIKIQDQHGRILKGKAIKKLHKGDIIEIADKGDNYTLGQDYAKNSVVELSLRKGVQVPKGSVLNRTRNNFLISEIHSKLEANELKKKVSGHLILQKGCPSFYKLSHNGIAITACGAIVEQAKNAPVTEEKIRKQVSKMGATTFELEALLVEMDSDIFLPMQQLNELRRMAVQQLEEAIVAPYRRHNEVEIAAKKAEPHSGQITYSAYVEQVGQLEEVIECREISYLYIDINMSTRIWNNREICELVNKAKENGIKVYLAMPHVLRLDSIQTLSDCYTELLKMGFDGMMVRDLGSYEFLQNNHYKGDIVMDYHMYQFNNESIEFWKDHDVTRMAIPLELNVQEIKHLRTENLELNIYGYAPMMISAQCITKSISGCKKEMGYTELKDRVNKSNMVKNCCDYCYNIVYNNCPTFLMDEWKEMMAINPSVLRMSFTVESKEETKRMLDLIPFLSNDIMKDNCMQECTKGHFRRGVK